MMIESPFDFLLPLFTLDTFWLLLKLMYLIAFGIYVVFALVVVSQVRQMTQTLNGSLDLPLKLLSWIHFGVAIGALLLAFVVL
jgi:hypothetical protein